MKPRRGVFRRIYRWHQLLCVSNLQSGQRRLAPECQNGRLVPWGTYLIRTTSESCATFAMFSEKCLCSVQSLAGTRCKRTMGEFRILNENVLSDQFKISRLLFASAQWWNSAIQNRMSILDRPKFLFGSKFFSAVCPP